VSLLAAAASKLLKLSVDVIRLDGGTQLRAQIDPTKVEAYGEKYEAGVRLPPPVELRRGRTEQCP